MTSPTGIQAEASVSVLEKEPEKPTGPAKVEGRSPGQLMWRRFKRDKTGLVSAVVVILFFAVALLAPVITKLYGKDPYTLYGQDNPDLLDMFNMPSGGMGGMSPEHWFGIEPTLGRDVFAQLLYGMRTSLFTAVAATIAMVVMGVLIGLVGGYFGGKTDYWIGRVTDFFLALPSQLFFVAAMPVITTVFVAPDEETPTYVRTCAIIGVMWLLGWMGLARLVRAVTLSLSGREFVEAAKVAGASPGASSARSCCRTSSPRSWCSPRTCCPAPSSRSPFSPSSVSATSNRRRTGAGCSPWARTSTSRTRSTCSSRVSPWSCSSWRSTSSGTPYGTPSTRRRVADPNRGGAASRAPVPTGRAGQHS